MALGTIGLRTKLLYGFGTVAYGIKDNGFNFLLLIFYNQLLGLPAQLVGLAIMIALIVDGFSDPLIGHISDRFHSRLGRRHFFMYLSALPCARFSTTFCGIRRRAQDRERYFGTS